MKNLVFILLLSVCSKGYSQESSLDLKLENAFATDMFLPNLVDSAFNNSAELKRINVSKEQAILNHKITKNSIYSGVSLGSSYSFGTNYSAVNTPSFEDVNTFTTNTQSGFYNIGLRLQVPLNMVLDRKNNLKISTYKIGIIDTEKEKNKLFIQQEVIRLYQDLKLNYRVLNRSIQNKKSSEINYEMSEREFLNGQLNIEQFSRVSEIHNKSMLEHETNLVRFQTSLMMLELYTGVNFIEFLNTKR